MQTTAYIHGLGYAVPQRLVTNKDLEALVDTTDEWIRTRTGIRQRYVIEHETASELATLAAGKALVQCGMGAADVTTIIASGCTPDAMIPSTASQIQNKIGAPGVLAFDMNGACSGFLYSLHMARSLVMADPDAVVLVCAVELLSTRTNWEDRSTCVLFGDGAGAAVISGKKRENGIAIGPWHASCDGSYGHLLTIGAGGMKMNEAGTHVDQNCFVAMKGQEVFKLAVRSMSASCKTLLDRNNLTIDDIDLLIPHQANARILEAVANRLKISPEKVFSNVERFANTSAASIAIAMAEAREKNVLKPHQKILLTAFGGGFSWGSMLLDS